MPADHNSLDLPDFPSPTALDATRSWTARLMSYDQRTEDCYYCVTLHGQATKNICVQISVHWLDGDLSAAETGERLRHSLHAAARRGESNTTYQGSLMNAARGSLCE